MRTSSSTSRRRSGIISAIAGKHKNSRDTQMKLENVIGGLIVTGIVALVGLVWNLNDKFTAFAIKASYTRGVICQIAHKNDVADVECQ